MEEQTKYNITMTGGGAAFVNSILGHCGGSKIINSINIPYSLEESAKLFQDTIIKFSKFCHGHDAFTSGYDNIVHTDPSFKYCSYQCAFMLALASYFNAACPNCSSYRYIGVSASLQNKDDPKDQRAGRENQAYVCLLTDKRIYFMYKEFDPELTREMQEEELEMFLKDILYDDYPNNARYFELHSALSIVDFIKTLNTQNFAFYSGSFSPAHEGHKYIATHAIDGGSRIILETPIVPYGKREEDVNPDYSIFKESFPPSDEFQNFHNRIICLRSNIPQIVQKIAFIQVIRTPVLFFDQKQLGNLVNLQNRVYKLGSDTLSRVENADLDMIRSLIQGKDRMHINFHIYLRPGSAFGNEYSTDCIVSKMLKLGFLASMFTLPEDIASSSSSAIRQAKSQAEVNS